MLGQTREEEDRMLLPGGREEEGQKAVTNSDSNISSYVIRGGNVNGGSPTNRRKNSRSHDHELHLDEDGGHRHLDVSNDGDTEQLGDETRLNVSVVLINWEIFFCHSMQYHYFTRTTREAKCLCRF